jgi:hypothetical protein
MINQFRTSSPINILLLFAYTFFMRIAILVDIPADLNFEFLEPYAKFFIQIPLQNDFSSTTNVLAAGLLVFVQAIIFNIVVNNHGLLPKPSYLPALLYITSASLFMPFLVLSPTLICNLLLIWMMDKLLKIGKSPNVIMIMFDIGMIIAAGTLIYFPFIVMLLMLWLERMGIRFGRFHYHIFLSGRVLLLER